MGKGDIKSKRGKIAKGSYGKSRPKNKVKTTTVIEDKTKKTEKSIESKEKKKKETK